MRLFKVKSSMIEKIGYDKAKKELVVQFNGGYRYSYANVSKQLCNKLWAAPSVGAYFCKWLKNSSKHPYTKLF
jgi:KTSC domain